MMPKSSEIEGLLSRLEAATGPDRELDHRLQGIFVNDDKFGQYEGLDEWVAAGMQFGWNTPAYTASVDAALALVERMGDGSNKHPVEITITSVGNNGPWRCAVWLGIDDTDGIYRAAPTAPLAILLALFRALSARPRP